MKKYLIIPVILVLVTTATPSLAQSVGQIILEPSKQSVSAGEDLTIKVSIDTGAGNETNSYQASLKYPEDKLTFESINTDTSPFNMALQATGENGEVKIIRGSVKKLEGKIFAANVKFKAKADTGADVVTVANDSAIIRSSDNTNVIPGSTLNNDSGNSESQDNVMAQISNKMNLSEIWGIFEKIKNFFSSLFG